VVDVELDTISGGAVVPIQFDDHLQREVVFDFESMLEGD
jgi:hypothetical protein